MFITLAARGMAGRARLSTDIVFILSPQGPGRRHRRHGARLVGALGLDKLNFMCEAISELFITIGIDFLHVVY